MRRLLARFVDDECGATAIEYCIIAAGISILIVGAVNGIGSMLNTKFTDVGTSIKQRQGRAGIMLELLFGSTLVAWGPPILTYVQQNPWRVFSVILVAVLLIDWMVNDRSPGSSDGGLDFGGGDGDGGGD